MKQPARRIVRLSLAMLAATLACFAMPVVASAKTVSVRVEIPSQNLVPRVNVDLGTTPIVPSGAPATESCAGDSVIGALDAATGSNWSGTWSNSTGWSIDMVKGITATVAQSRRWFVYLNRAYMNDAPCQHILSDGDELLLYPSCTAAGANICFTGFPIWMQMGTTGSPGVFFRVQAWELPVAFDTVGVGITTSRALSGAKIMSNDATATTDTYGIANVLISSKGDNPILGTKSGDVPDRGTVCITDGQDGYCGTTPAPQNPFDPYAFCQTNGNDGYCNTPDHVPPVGHIGSPPNGLVYPAGQHPDTIKGTVDFDPSMTDHVDLRLMRQIRAKVVVRVKKKKVWVKRRVHGKVVRKRVVKRKKIYGKRTICQGWNVSTSTFKQLKKCDPALAKTFRADGAETWSYKFLERLPAGVYTLDALAVDGAGNVDSTMEAGRNRVTFTAQ